MVNYNEFLNLLSSDELPDSDDEPMEMNTIKKMIDYARIGVLFRITNHSTDSNCNNVN